MNDDATVNKPKDLSEYAQEIKKKKDEETKEILEKLKARKEKLSLLNAATKGLLDELFDISQTDAVKKAEIIKKLSEMSDERIKLNMAVYKWENKWNQLKYV